MSPELTRRDALAALAGGGAVGAAVGLADLADSGDEAFSAADVETLVALAEVIYPSEVTVTTAFVQTYVDGLPAERRDGIAEATSRLDNGARRFAGEAFAGLDPGEREAVLRRMGVQSAESDSGGGVPERIRYHLVNSLLYALFTSPMGSELVGISNPTGHPGGYESLTRAPEGKDG
jgi:hypothetical protein